MDDSVVVGMPICHPSVLPILQHTWDLTTVMVRIQRLIRPLTAKLRWRPFSSVSHVSDSLELHNNNWASWILHPGTSESDVYSDVIQEAKSNDLLHTVRFLMRLDTPLYGNNARDATYTVYYASVATHAVFETIKWLRSELCWIKNVAVPSLACLFPGLMFYHHKSHSLYKSKAP